MKVARLIAVGLIAGAVCGCGAAASAVDGGGAGSGGAGGGGAGGAGTVDGGGAGSGGKTDGSSADAIVGDGGDACVSLAGHTFISVNLLDCSEGINPQAPPCNWSVTFTTAGGFSYSEGGADVPITGTYICAGGSITGTTTYLVPTLVYHGTYGGPGSELVWDNQRFH